MTLRNPRRIIRIASLTLAMLPPLATLIVILRLAVNVPLQDDWDLVTVIAKTHEGSAAFNDFWQQHSEHRIPALRFVIWCISLVSHYNVVTEMLVGFTFAVITLPIVYALLRRSLANHAPSLIVPATIAA